MYVTPSVTIMLTTGSKVNEKEERDKEKKKMKKSEKQVGKGDVRGWVGRKLGTL